MILSENSANPRGRLREAEAEEGEYSVEEEGYEGTEVEYALEDCPEDPKGPNLALSNQPLASQDEPSLLKMMEHMTKFMLQLAKEVSKSRIFKAPAFRNPPKHLIVLW
ncbi:hypothetical protein O181_003501 [Austropuccinia psidii MF-1]|uniref:Uncharacterized protein n=1 Tax=Austropuccinia psidii MF-1 TaxID=1389203 RepID=A0A9Q3BDV5_9BASI|nr:hypothetical protein [Austropuccinia psidii MF-1]